jgi:hypothetical protein
MSQRRSPQGRRDDRRRVTLGAGSGFRRRVTPPGFRRDLIDELFDGREVVTDPDRQDSQTPPGADPRMHEQPDSPSTTGGGSLGVLGVAVTNESALRLRLDPTIRALEDRLIRLLGCSFSQLLDRMSLRRFLDPDIRHAFGR